MRSDDKERDSYLKKEYKKRKNQLKEGDFEITDEDLDELVKRFPAPKEWYYESHSRESSSDE